MICWSMGVSILCIGRLEEKREQHILMIDDEPNEPAAQPDEESAEQTDPPEQQVTEQPAEANRSEGAPLDEAIRDALQLDLESAGHTSDGKNGGLLIMGKRSQGFCQDRRR